MHISLDKTTSELTDWLRFVNSKTYKSILLFIFYVGFKK